MTQYKPQVDLVHRELSLMLPRFYDDAPEADGILYADAVEVERVRADARELLAQLSVATATWGLSDWERVLDLPPRPNSSADLRRARILAKLRGTAPATIVNMLAIINAHVPQRDASIVELPEPGVINVEIPVQNDLALNELHADINTYKPAHLTFMLHLPFDTQHFTLSDFQYVYPIYYGKCGELMTYPILGAIFNGQIGAVDESYDYPIYYNPADTFNTDLLAGHLLGTGGSIEQIANATTIPYPMCGQFMTGGF